MFGLGTWEILLILIAALVFIGPSKLPSLARTMGKGMRDVRRAMAGFEDEVRQASTIPDADADAPPPAVSKAPDNGVTIPRTDAKTANAPPSDEASTGDDALTEGGDSDSESDNKHV